MTVESAPCLREIILEPAYMAPLDFIEIDVEEILDQTGNPIRDQNGSVIYD